MFWIQYFSAGIWSYVWHWGTGIGLIGISLFLAFASQAVLASIPLIGPWAAKIFQPLSTQLIWFAVAVAVFMGGMFVGNQDATNKCLARQTVVEQKVKALVGETKTPNAQKLRDIFDDPNN